MLSRPAQRAFAEFSLLPGGPEGLTLTPGRVHEFCGPARRALAALALSADRREAWSPVVWVHPGWVEEGLSADGLAPFLDPGRVLLVEGQTLPDVLWAAEEALRIGVGLVVADLPEVPDLTPMRRLQLAAEAGGGAALAVVLTPGEGGAAGATSRWSLAPAPRGGWLLARLQARLAPPATWRVGRGPDGFTLQREPDATPVAAAA